MSTRQQRGFTLIEVMIATLIFAFIAIATTEAIRRNRDSKERIDEDIDTYQAIRASFAILRKDFSNVYFLNESDFVPFGHRKTKTDADINKYRSIKPSFIGTESAAHFTTLTNYRLYADQHESDQAEVSFYIEKDKNDPSMLNLYRRQSPIIDEYPDEGGSSYLLLEDLAAFKIRYFDVVKEQWSDSWDSRNEGHLGEIPEIIEVTMTVNLRSPSRIDLIKKIELTEVFHPMFINSYKKRRMGVLEPHSTVLAPPTPQGTPGTAVDPAQAFPPSGTP